MKKIKYRNNNFTNQIYSINYKFDSISPAGKCCGTALDLIKRYNELAKEAHSNGNFVEAEVFRQYAEHYRKIVTEINERKNVRFNSSRDNNANSQNSADDTSANTDSTEIAVDKNLAAPAQETSADISEISESSSKKKVDENTNNTLVETKPRLAKKAFTVIEVSEEVKPKRTYKPRTKKGISA